MCGIFQLYFYKKLFDPLEDSQIIYHEKLTKQAIEKVLNESLSKYKASNEKKSKILKKNMIYKTNMFVLVIS